MKRPTTLGELKASGWTPKSVRDELRTNLIESLRRGENVFEGIVGFDRTVLPQVQNAILSRHDFILLGLRGQAKTRILRTLPRLLDERIPMVDGSEIRDDPMKPIGADSLRRLQEMGDDLPIRWVEREERYHEKLATPDVTIADLIGDLDPIKAARRQLEFADPEVIHYGLVPRSNRGILAINELPDLSARIQVGLLNILEEGDVQIRGFPVRLPLDICLVFSANPEDYTNRGSIITPLRDRIASQILTHYPRSVAEAMRITAQEAWIERTGEVKVLVPDYLRHVIEEVAFQARGSDFVDQRSGVSARMTIALMENVISNAERRALGAGEERTVARVGDLLSAVSAVSGKIELVYDGEREGVRKVSLMLLGKAIQAVFDARLPDAYAEGPGGEGGEAGASHYEDVAGWFQAGNGVELADDLAGSELCERLGVVTGLERVAREFLPVDDEASLGAAMEFVVEGLHQRSVLSRQELVGGFAYGDMLAEMARSLES